MGQDQAYQGLHRPDMIPVDQQPAVAKARPQNRVKDVISSDEVNKATADLGALPKACAPMAAASSQGIQGPSAQPCLPSAAAVTDPNAGT